METLILTKPRLAFAGVGWIGRNRMQAALDSGLAEVAILSDPSEACLQEATRMAPESVATHGFDATLSEGIDGVVIATPSALHREQALAALEQGKAVFCQKPLGRNANEVLAVVEAAAKANRLLGADFSYRHTAAFQAILPFIRSGELGELFHIDLKFHNAYGPDKPWFYDKQLSGGGCVLDLGIHLVDLMLYALDFPEVNSVHSSLFAKGQRLANTQEVEDFADVQLGLASGASANLACSWHLQAGCEAVIEASFYGTKGGVALKNIGGSFYDFAAYRYWGTRSEVLVNPPDDWGGRALVQWIGQLGKDPSFNPEAYQFIHSAAVLDRIYASLQ